MAKRNPTVLSKHLKGDIIELTLRVDDDIAYFQGHFNSLPILPGITQIDWAVQYGAKYLKSPSQFSGMEAIKFIEPILPGNVINLKLDWSAGKRKLQFCYFSNPNDENNSVIHSSGRISLI